MLCACCTAHILFIKIFVLGNAEVVTQIMQDKKQYSEKLFKQFQLSHRVPMDNFYRRLKEMLDLPQLHLDIK
jgi:hypothetical protein